MAKPVTQAQMKKAIAPLATKKFVKTTIAPLATKQEIDEKIASLATKQDLDERIASAIAPLATKKEMHEALELWAGALWSRMDARFTEQSKELARHVQAVLEEVRTMIRAVDDKYADLPGRVSRLEAERGH